MELVCINDEIFEPKNAKISVYDRGFIYGDAVYEVTRSYGKILFKLEDHIERLQKSATRIKLDLQKSKAQLIDYLYGIYRQADLPDAYLRVQVTRGEEPIQLAPGPNLNPNFVVWVQKAAVISKGQPVRLYSSSVMRNPKKALDPNIKSGNYLNNILAAQEAKQNGFYDAIMLNAEGMVVEGTTFNIFMVKGQKVISPPDEADMLWGITRNIVMDLAKPKYTVEKRFFDLKELQSADEVFITGSVREIMAVGEVNQSIIGTGEIGPVTNWLSMQYKTVIQSYLEWAQKNHPWKK